MGQCQRYVSKRWQPEKVCLVEKFLEELPNKNPEQALVKNETCPD
ncbi:hypothetical protein [Nostoc sp. UHCC 0252]|nr:hypothetical protein [Nostoc sp. UHCC 0252]MEA5600511.1 hypothetical protein [Nostoc sp. UHCC 0252]